MSSLFDLPPLPEPEAMSATRRLTQRNDAVLAQGRHPATGARLIVGATCGGCSHHHAFGWHNGTYHKCDEHRLGMSHSAASDIRVGWPACERYETAAS